MLCCNKEHKELTEIAQSVKVKYTSVHATRCTADSIKEVLGHTKSAGERWFVSAMMVLKL